MATKGTEVNISSVSLENIGLESHKEHTSEFSNVSLEVEQEKPKRLILKDPKDPAFVNKKGKKPRRVLHFSDGVLEEYSETEDEDEVDNTPKVDPKALKWMPWFWYYTSLFGSKSLGAADMCGEKLAWFFGITSPKYQYAIDEYNELKREEEEEKEREARELELLQERHMKGSHPDEEAVTGAVPEVAFSNQAFMMTEESQAINKDIELPEKKQSTSENKAQESQKF